MPVEYGKPRMTPTELLGEHKVILKDLQEAYAKRAQADFEYKRLLLQANAMYVSNVKIAQALGITEVAVRYMIQRLRKGSRGWQDSGRRK